jgi:cellulose synthase/poly-beta-1,6-N-acetylglucosamine synthase-like glycosyltransferase
MFSIKSVIYVAAFFFIAYLPRIYCWFASLKKQKHLTNQEKNRIALFIPARNEGKAVLPLLESISRQTYDRDLFDVFIVVKEADDPVIGYGNDAGAEVFVDSEQTCKGDCLNFGFNKILHKYPGKYDGFMIVDADCVLTPTFMEEMNNAMASGADVINAKKLVGNYFLNGGKNSNLITACNGLIWTLMDDMGNRWKSDHGFTTMTITTGILISSRLVEKWDGWIYRSTITEDMELQRDCSLKEYRTFYYSHAKFFMQEAPSLEETNKRRSRWMNGLTHADFIYGHDMLRKHSFHALADNYFMFCLWIVYLFIASNLFIALVNIVCCALTIILSGTYEWGMLFVSGTAFASIYCALFLLTLTALFVSRRDVHLSAKQQLEVLFIHPIFYMGYISIEVHAIFDRRPMEWEKIERVDESENAVERHQ